MGAKSKQYFGQWKLLNSWEKCKRNKSSQIDHKAKQWKAENYSLTSGVCSALGLLGKPILHILILTRGVLGMALFGTEEKLGIDYLRMFDYCFMVCWGQLVQGWGVFKGPFRSSESSMPKSDWYEHFKADWSHTSSKDQLHICLKMKTWLLLISSEPSILSRDTILTRVQPGSLNPSHIPDVTFTITVLLKWNYKNTHSSGVPCLQTSLTPDKAEEITKTASG